MRILIILAAVIYFSTNSCAQVNIVQNGGFESYSSCPVNAGQINRADGWETPNHGSPDYYNSCSVSDHLVPPDVVYGFEYPNSGSSFAGMYFFSFNQPEGREYIQTRLSEPLHAGVRYKVSFYVSLAELSRYALSSIGAYLSVDQIQGNEFDVLEVEPQIQNPAGNIIADTSGWVLITDTFRTRAVGGEEWLTIGNFNYAADSDTFAFQPPNLDMGNFFHSYYYIDDVSVVALDSIPNSVTELEEEDDDFLVYPNPTNGLITLNYALDEGDRATLSVYTYTGALVQERVMNDENLSMDIDLTNVETGLYILRVDVNGTVKLFERISVIR